MMLLYLLRCNLAACNDLTTAQYTSHSHPTNAQHLKDIISVDQEISDKVVKSFSIGEQEDDCDLGVLQM